VINDLNQAILVGTVGSEIQLREADGKAVCSFVVGTQTFGETVWHKVRAWGYRAKRCERMLMVGSRVQIMGPILYQKSKGKRGGVRTVAEIHALEIDLV
jgi:single-stranded DNA-binding protein